MLIWTKKLQKLAKYHKINQLMAQFREMKENLEPDLAIYHIMMNAQIKKNRLGTLLELFQEAKSKFIPETQTFNILIHALGSMGHIQEALGYFKQLESWKLKPNISTFSTLLKIFEMTSAEQRIHFFRAFGLEKDASIQQFFEALNSAASQAEIQLDIEQIRSQKISILIRMDLLEEAISSFSQHLDREIPPTKVINSFLNGLARNSSNSRHKMMDLFRILLEKDPTMLDGASFSIYLNALLLEKSPTAFSKALNVPIQMKSFGLIPDVFIFTALMRGCVTRAPQMIERLYQDLLREGILPDQHVMNLTLLGVVLSESPFSLLLSLFEEMKRLRIPPDISTYSILLQGCAKHQRLSDFESIFLSIPLHYFKSPKNIVREKALNRIFESLLSIRNLAPTVFDSLLPRFTTFQPLSAVQSNLLNKIKE